MAQAVTAGLVCDVAIAIRFREPGTAKLTAPVRDRDRLRGAGASVTDVVCARVATSAAGPPSVRLKVSVTLPVLVTVIWKLLPGAPVDVFSDTATPLATTTTVRGGRAGADADPGRRWPSP